MRQLGLHWVAEGVSEDRDVGQDPGLAPAPRSAEAGQAARLMRAEPIADVDSTILGSGGRVFRDIALGTHDEAVQLLHAAAEIEHSLLVQYLYAAYSLDTKVERWNGSDPPAAPDLVRMWRDSILTIAVQEMGHLLTVQNMIRFIGGPLNFERAAFPWGNELCPVPFELKPLSKETLAVYIGAEMPHHPSPKILPPEVRADLVARLEKSERFSNRVGVLYHRLHHLFMKLDVGALDPDSIQFQARALDWGADEALLVREIGSRDDALTALHDIGHQGEGWGGREDRDTHFERFLTIYRDPAFPEGPLPRSWAVRPMAVNPCTEDNRLLPPGARASSRMVIKNSEARDWARLFNLRYRMLLYEIDHSLRVGDATVDEQLLRRVLIFWSRRQMTSGLHEIALKLCGLPVDSDPSTVAGPPFELPFTLATPDREVDRWRMHRDMIETSKSLVEKSDTLRRHADSDILRRLRRLDDEIGRFIVDHDLDRPSRTSAGRPGSERQ